ncbi:MAG: VanW family protein [Bacteroidaceae bacterium]|nr:VanW family protein [Bacteroidaceae bacterium]
MARKLFCEICPFTYALSLQKERLKRHIRNLLGNERYAFQYDAVRLPVVVASQHNNMIKRGPDINPLHQQNKADNIRLACSKIDGLLIRPGETFSFWKIVGKTSRQNGFKDGRILVNGQLTAGVGGGLCNLANTINLLILYSPMTITELHHHSDALAPDPNGLHRPYSAGTSVNYNFIDYRFRNDTDQTVQLCTWCEGDELMAELRSEYPYPYTYRLTEEEHHFHQEADGAYYRISKIYRETIDRETGEVIDRELNWDNHSRVMFDPSLLPPEQIQ